MTEAGELRAANTADTEVFYMAGRQLPQLSTLLQQAGWPAETPALVVSHAGRPDALSSEHRVADLADAAAQHAERPTIVVVGAGIALHNSPGPGKPGAPPRIQALPRCGAPHPPSSPTVHHDPRRHRSLHPLQVHRLRRCLPRGLLPRRPQLPRHRPRRVHRLRGLHPLECPVNAIVPEEDVAGDQQHMIKINADLSKKWPSITKRKAALPDADDWKDKTGKLDQLIR